MEIKFLNISCKLNNIKIKNFNLKIQNNRITGLYNDNLNLIISLLTKKINYSGDILINNRPLIYYQDNLMSYANLNNNLFFTKKVKDEFYLMQRKVSNLTEEEYHSKIISVLNLVGLDEYYLERENYTLANSEKKLIKIALNLIINPDILILNEPFKDLDKKHITYLKKIIFDLKKEYLKTIIIITKDINILYELTDDLIILSENKVVIADKTTVVFKNLAFLEENGISYPNLIKFNQIAKNYNQTLKNTKDIKDLIKEVYKNVQEIKNQT